MPNRENLGGISHQIAMTQVSTDKIKTAMATYPGADAARVAFSNLWQPIWRLHPSRADAFSTRGSESKGGSDGRRRARPAQGGKAV